MTGQSTIPPPYIWERIEKILDEQDEVKKQTEKLISETFRVRNIRRQNMFLALITTVGLIALVVLNYNGNLKQS
jgi:uncharacterized membrane protein SpoIIM required for sporulation